MPTLVQQLHAGSHVHVSFCISFRCQLQADYNLRVRLLISMYDNGLNQTITHMAYIHLQVLFNMWKLNHNPEYWDEPWEFRPERFLDEDGTVVKPDHINRKR